MTAEAFKGFPKTIQSALRDGKTDYAIRLFNEDKYSDDVKNNSWDLILAATEHLTEENRCKNPELFNCYTCAIWIAHPKHFSQTPSDKTSDKYEEEIRNKILAASLPFVLELGWSKECLTLGAEQVGYPGISHGMFTRGTGDLVHYFNTSSNAKLVDILKQLQKDFSQKPVSPGHFVELAIQERLKMLVPYVNRWPQAIAIMSLPPNVPNGLAALLAMVDDICYYAGDRSVDFNWYMRRLGVAGVYKATELYLIQDKSAEQKDTWAFLTRRMEEAVQLHDIISKSDIATQGAKDVAKSAFVTARNILGVSWNK